MTTLATLVQLAGVTCLVLATLATARELASAAGSSWPTAYRVDIPRWAFVAAAAGWPLVAAGGAIRLLVG